MRARGVKVASTGVRGASRSTGCRAPGCVVGGMWEDVIAAAVGPALVGHLLYAVVRPDRVDVTELNVALESADPAAGSQ